MSVKDDILALSPDDQLAIFNALAPALAAQNFALAIDKQVQDFADATAGVVNGLLTEASNRKAAFAAGDLKQQLLQDADIAAAQAALPVKALGLSTKV